MAYIPYAEVESVQMFTLGNEEIQRESYADIHYQDLFRGGEPFPGGLYDLHMGTTDHDFKCSTCQHGKKDCPGHYGSYRLNVPVLSPLFVKDIVNYLRVICFECGKVVVDENDDEEIENGRGSAHSRATLNSVVKRARKPNKNIICRKCSAIHPVVVYDPKEPTTIVIKLFDNKSESTAGSEPKVIEHAVLHPHQIAAIFDRVDDDTVTRDLGRPITNHPRRLVWDVLRVPPNTIRPSISLMGTARSSTDSNDLTILLQNIMKINDSLPQDLTPEMPVNSALADQIRMLNLSVYALVRGQVTTGKQIMTNTRRPIMSIAKRWPRKYGRIRRNLMGRRANHMARSFITGDPLRRIDEIGLPLSIAKNILFPVVVREYNYKECLQLYLSGPNHYPGVVKVKKGSTGATHWIGRIREDFRLEIGDTIYRHTITGDRVNFNRQPSLEASSVSSMRPIVMGEDEGQTIDFNVISCVLFN
jgi:DNA-directed RNA polymerase II subunit RPB1